jgi:hypothetical protein
MAHRLYTVQGSYPRTGWVDLEFWSTKEKPCIDRAEEFTTNTGVVTRVIRKPHGWVPPEDFQKLT